MKQKNLVWAVAGATVILSVAGCAKTQLMVDRNITAAGDDPSGMVAATPMQPAIVPQDPVMPQEPMPQPPPPPVVQPREVTPAPQNFQYQAMTGVTSTGGISSTGKKAGTKGTKAVATKGTYIIQKGDYPERIARKHGVRLADLMRVNNLNEDSARRLRPGKKLIIPDARIRTSGKRASAPAGGPFSNGKYIIKKGDTPERIARRFKVKLNELMQANNLDESSARRLQPGKSLVIPGRKSDQSAKNVAADSKKTVSTGSKNADTAVPADTLKVGAMKQVTRTISMRDFAAENNVSYDDFKKINFDANETLNAGDWVYMPAK